MTPHRYLVFCHEHGFIGTLKRVLVPHSVYCPRCRKNLKLRFLKHLKVENGSTFCFKEAVYVPPFTSAANAMKAKFKLTDADLEDRLITVPLMTMEQWMRLNKHAERVSVVNG